MTHQDLWLIVLTVAVILQFIAGRKARTEQREVMRTLEKRFNTLDLREAMQDVVQLVRRQHIHADSRAREAIERLITRLEADPITRDSYRPELVTLKEHLRTS